MEKRGSEQRHWVQKQRRKRTAWKVSVGGSLMKHSKKKNGEREKRKADQKRNLKLAPSMGTPRTTVKKEGKDTLAPW